MHTASYEFLMKPKESARCHQTLSARVGSGDETSIYEECVSKYSNKTEAHLHGTATYEVQLLLCSYYNWHKRYLASYLWPRTQALLRKEEMSLGMRLSYLGAIQGWKCRMCVSPSRKAGMLHRKACFGSMLALSRTQTPSNTPRGKWVWWI